MRTLQRQPNYRSRALLDLAHSMPCFFTFPHTCQGQTVPCHANWQAWGRGGGYKTPDWAWAAGCGDAHRAIDDKLDKRLDQDQRQTEWMISYLSTWNWIWEHGLLTIRKNPKAA